MIYDLSHITTFNYAANVDISQHVVHLTPRRTPGQTVHRYALLIDPTPTVSKASRDYFENLTTYLTVEQPHRRLRITSNSRVEVTSQPSPEPSTTAPWDAVKTAVEGAVDAPSLHAAQFAFESQFTVSVGAYEYALPSFPEGRPLLEAAIDLMRRIFKDFKYEGGATDIYTPIDTVLKLRRGVCQDFAHLQIACLRAFNLPARYVSGYLLTHPPEGQEKLVGSDASHAWLSVWVPEHGWVDLDPTNNVVPTDEHITVAWGRDYGDVSPISGMVLGGGEQKIKVEVDVRPAKITC